MRSLLIANRGEIACRIMRTARRRGLHTIAVYSRPDAQAQHVLQADTAVCIGEAPAAQSYLDIDRIMAAATQCSADAIHPGYGFLSENPALVDACTAAGIVFVGPSSEAMRAMGLKDAAKRLMSDAGVPVVPGYHGTSQQVSLLENEARAIGYPVLIKARAGGGGKGMRRVDSPDTFPAALAAAQREAQASFGDAHVLIEKYIAAPRHIEVQIFGDAHGQVVHLFERDCTLQRRHQKVIEEAPAPGMNQAVREAMTDAAVRAAKAIDYQGAGTVEFIVDGSQGLRTDGFWFMEMNTRLQVEHPVTEAITGVDLVDWQLRVAAGEPLPLRQDQLYIQGHAVEARLYAENPATGFLPAVGTLLRFRPSVHGRTDSGVVEGDSVLPFYDPLLAKLISHAVDRRSAFLALTRQLGDTVVLGTTTNREFLWRLASHAQVIEGQFDTSFIDTELTGLLDSGMTPSLLAVAALFHAAPLHSDHGDVGRSDPGDGVTYGAPVAMHDSAEWAGKGVGEPTVARRLGSWQCWGSVQRHVMLETEAGVHRFDLVKSAGRERNTAWCVRCPTLEMFPDQGIAVQRLGPDRVRVQGRDWPLHGVRQGHQLFVQLGPVSTLVALPVAGLSSGSGPTNDTVVSPMPGRVVAVHCNVGDSVKSGEPLVIVEAMKMEQSLCSERDGVVHSLSVRVDQQVSQGQELVRLVAGTDADSIPSPP